LVERVKKGGEPPEKKKIFVWVVAQKNPLGLVKTGGVWGVVLIWGLAHPTHKKPGCETPKGSKQKQRWERVGFFTKKKTTMGTNTKRDKKTLGEKNHQPHPCVLGCWLKIQKMLNPKRPGGNKGGTRLGFGCLGFCLLKKTPIP